MFLIDTMVLSELRKRQRDPGVVALHGNVLWMPPFPDSWPVGSIVRWMWALPGAGAGCQPNLAMTAVTC